MFYIYILYSPKSDRYYVGHTEDINRRLNEHNYPTEKTKYTSKFLPWQVEYIFPVSENRGEAIKIERFIKNQKSKVFIKKLITEKDNENNLDTLINKVLKNRLVRAIPSPRD
jgi:putative endonuclease